MAQSVKAKDTPVPPKERVRFESAVRHLQAKLTTLAKKVNSGKPLKTAEVETLKRQFQKVLGGGTASW
jgi:hypothetical protein